MNWLPFSTLSLLIFVFRNLRTQRNPSFRYSRRKRIVKCLFLRYFHWKSGYWYFSCRTSGSLPQTNASLSMMQSLKSMKLPCCFSVPQVGHYPHFETPPVPAVSKKWNVHNHGNRHFSCCSDSDGGSDCFENVVESRNGTQQRRACLLFSGEILILFQFFQQFRC